MKKNNVFKTKISTIYIHVKIFEKTVEKMLKIKNKKAKLN
jgi:hypothetical protein